jgi:hypothetical protein
MRGEHARNLARDADLVVVRVAEHGVVRVNRGVLEVGPEASSDAIATLACRRLLRGDGEQDEQLVQRFVESLGFAYVPDGEGPECERTSGLAYRAVS